jgi:hypothetical protein
MDHASRYGRNGLEQPGRLVGPQAQDTQTADDHDNDLQDCAEQRIILGGDGVDQALQLGDQVCGGSNGDRDCEAAQIQPALFEEEDEAGGEGCQQECADRQLDRLGHFHSLAGGRRRAGRKEGDQQKRYEDQTFE